jgi:(2S)-methylsuccinyl-CoA dehydrogenase
MALDGQNAAMQTENYTVMPDLLATTQQAFESLDTLFAAAKETVKSLVSKDGRISSGLMEATTSSHTWPIMVGNLPRIYAADAKLGIKVK